MCLGRAACLGADAAGVWSSEVGREEMQLWREIENLEWKVITIEARVYLVFILCIYPGSFPIFFYQNC